MNRPRRWRGWGRLLLPGAAALVVWATYLTWPRGEEMEQAPMAIAVSPLAASNEPIRPLSPASPADARKVALGRRLFHEPMLSRDGSRSCAKCHDLARGGVDGLVRSVGLSGSRTPVNTPTVFNSARNFRQFWDGRAADLAAQIDEAREHEMGRAWAEIAELLAADEAYRRELSALYGEIDEEAVTDALVAFIGSLSTPGSRFDRYLLGQRDALSPTEVEGYRLFKDLGCVACHQGEGMGGNMFQRFGTVGDYFADRGGVTDADLGRFNVTGDPRDRHVFKVPSLRNVALTAPYFHDGSAATLEQAVTVMARYQLGQRLEAAETAAIAAFLRTLTGEYEGRPLDAAEPSGAAPAERAAAEAGRPPPLGGEGIAR